MNTSMLISKINDFIDKRDISTKNAQEIDFLLGELNIDNELMDELVLMIASYVPGGGDFLFDEEKIIFQLKKVLIFLESNGSLGGE